MGNDNNTLGALMRDSVIITGALALISVGGTFLIMLAGQPVPPLAEYFAVTCMAYFFGARVERTRIRGTVRDEIKSTVDPQYLNQRGGQQKDYSK